MSAGRPPRVPVEFLGGLVARNRRQLLGAGTVLGHRAQRGLSDAVRHTPSGQAGSTDRQPHQVGQRGALDRPAIHVPDQVEAVGRAGFKGLSQVGVDVKRELDADAPP